MRALLALTVVVLAGAPANDATLLRPRWNRAEMEARLEPGGRFVVIYGTRDPAATPALRARALQLVRWLADGDTSAVLADAAATQAAITGRAIALVGGPRENAWTARLAPALPVEFTPQGFRWHGRDYDRAGDVLHLAWPSPLDPVRFLLLVAPNTPAAPDARGPGMMLGDEDWRIVRDGELARSGRFAQEPGTPWRYDPALDRDREGEREAFLASLRTIGAGAVHVRSRPGTAGAAATLAAAETMIARLDALGLRAPRRGAIELTLYPSLESKGALTRSTRPEHMDAGGAVHAALPAGRERLDLWSVAAARLVQLGADRDSPFLEAAGAWLADRLEGESVAQAVSRLYFGRVLPRAEDVAGRPPLLDDGSSPPRGTAARTEARRAWRSPLVWVPARALLVRAVAECAPAASGEGGARAVLALLRADPPGTLDSLCRRCGVTPAAVARRYATLADSLARAADRQRRTHEPEAWRPSDGFQRGVCLAHSVRLEGGYISAACDRELARLAGMGAGWVSLSPFGYLPGDGAPVILPSANGGPDEESDEAVCEAAAHARTRGLRVWLAPNLWSRGWVGTLQFSSGNWARFFDRYREFILHYALLAERERMDGLIVGHEMTTASLGFPDRWRAIIADVRRVYDGTLTYGANWDREVDGIAFWDALDLVGVSFYYPLASKPTHAVPELREGAHRALTGLRALGARVGRPVLITEAGYAPTPDAPVRPWEESRDASDPESQRAAYQALVEALDRETWVAGLFWWKWFSGERPQGPRDGSYSPRGRPAEAVMSRALSGWAGRPVTVPKP